MTQQVGKLYKSVIDDVVASVREAFADEGIDEQVLLDLKATWEKRLTESKAVVDAATSAAAALNTSSATPVSTVQASQSSSTSTSQEITAPVTAPAIAPSTAITVPAPTNHIVQLDGPVDTDDEDDEDEDEIIPNDDDHDENDDDVVGDEDGENLGEDEEPLNSGDDVSDEEPNELFETDNVVVCQYDKITRSRNKWKFHLKDGIMNLQGRDYVFQKAVGDAEW